MKKYLVPYGWIGLVIMITAEWQLFRGNTFVSTWMTPIMWSGYILLADNIIFGRSNSSLIRCSKAQLPVLLLFSICSWLLFEGYNVFIKNWYYYNLPEELWVRYLGYAWSFATITPGILVTKDLLKSFKILDSVGSKPIRISNKFLKTTITVSAFLSIYPLIFPNKYLFPLVWCSYIFLIDPLNYILGGKSITKDLTEGRPGTLYQLLLAGLICGFLWEFWNYWAMTKWIYTVPYFPQYKLFEMPVVGYLGFPLFAIECYVLYQLFKVLLEKIGVSLRYS